jgi:hypothetical protein
MSYAHSPPDPRDNAVRLLLLSLLLLTTSPSLHARIHRDYTAWIRHAESIATPAGRKVLRTARSMVNRKAIIRGSCWNYLNAVFVRAGYPKAKRQVVYRKGKGGPYANISQIQPGDWLYYINHSYGGVEHSGMFIDWIDRDRKQGLILSYGGERRNKPGRYRPYDLRSVYQIIRPY